MKLLHWLSQLLWLCLLLSQNVLALQDEPIPMVTSDFPPFIDQSLPESNVITQLIRATLKQMNRRLDLSWQPWARGESSVKKGMFFAIFPYYKTKQRQKNFHFSDPIYYGNYVFYRLDSNQQINAVDTADQLRSVKIAGIRGYSYVDDFADAGLELHLVNTEKQLLGLLLRKRVDLIILDSIAGDFFLGNNLPTQANSVTKLPSALFPKKPLHLMISKSYPLYLQLTDEFNAALKKIKHSSKFATQP
ncbi:MAG: transporter substrate-binding domain-containing protein [Oceanospirillaceae bacterium]|nr:transporter substrate-binding domain-containing protein [Oceanospirillaceae bacterium]